MKIGFIGLGIMGSRMAANLLGHGHDLVVFNRSKEKADSLIGNGATWADTPASAAERVELLFTMLAHPAAVTEAALGDRGFLRALRPNALWVDCSTVNPSFSRKMAAEAHQHGVRFLDAPVGGSKNPAEQAQLVFIVGGDKADVEAVQPLFEIMGSRVVHVGGHGMGTSLKLVINQQLATAMAAFSEGMVLGQALGIPQGVLLNALLESPVVAPFVAMKRKKLEQGNYEPEFPLRWMQKDLQMASETAYEVGVAAPVANAAKELYRLAIQKGLGQLDFSAIYSFLQEGSGRE